MLTYERIMNDKLLQLASESQTIISLNILSFSAITNLCTKYIQNFSEQIMQPIDVSLNIIFLYSLSSAIELINTCPEDTSSIIVSKDLSFIPIP